MLVLYKENLSSISSYSEMEWDKCSVSDGI